MRIYPVVSNEVNIELEDGTLFNIHEGREGLAITALEGTLIIRSLNVDTIELDEVWRGKCINLVGTKDA